MKYKDYYATLEVERGAGADEIKRAYRRLARKFHPDVSKETDAEERFKEVGEAYEVLKDPEKRAAYDNLGADWRSGQEFRPPPGWETRFHDFGSGSGSGPGFGAGGFDFSDFFESLFGGAGPGPGPRRRAAPRRGQDQRVRVRLGLEEAFHGGERSIQLQGPGADGSARTRTLKVRIPARVTDGQQIRLSGQGGPGAVGGGPGDLYMEVELAPHPHFQVEGRDIHLTLPVTPWEAALGATVAVPTLGGRVDLKIPAGSQSGRKLRLKGRGLGARDAGDQYVVLQIVTPPADTEEARELYRRMSETLDFDPRGRAGL